MSNVKLKPCPFCGNKKIRIYKHKGYNADNFSVLCEPDEYPCGAQGPIDVEKKAVAKWNERKEK